MDLKGIFTPNTVRMPQWKNKKGENEFENMLDRLADLGKKLSSPADMKKKAETYQEYMDKPPVDMTNTEELNEELKKKNEEERKQMESLVSAEYMEARPRPLSEIFNSKENLAQQAILKARDIVGSQLAKLNLPSSEIYYLRSDISRYGGDGTPSTGRISFQMPILTAEGDQRTIYADVDIVLGNLMPPRQFFDGVNQRYAFTPDGVSEFLAGRTFDIMSNPKVKPETVYFEAPGHLAGKGGFSIKKTASVMKTAVDEQEQEVFGLIPGHQIANAIQEFENIVSDISELEKKLKVAKNELDERMKSTQEFSKVKEQETALKKRVKEKGEKLSLLEEFLGTISGKAVESKGRIYKLIEKMEKSRTPVYSGIFGKLIEEFPSIKASVDQLWEEVRSTTDIKSLQVKSPTEEKDREYEIRKDRPKQPDVPLYSPPKKESAQSNGSVKTASLFQSLENLLDGILNVDTLLDEAGV